MKDPIKQVLDKVGKDIDRIRYYSKTFEYIVKKMVPEDFEPQHYIIDSKVSDRGVVWLEFNFFYNDRPERNCVIIQVRLNTRYDSVYIDSQYPGKIDNEYQPLSQIDNVTEYIRSTIQWKLIHQLVTGELDWSIPSAK